MTKDEKPVTQPGPRLKTDDDSFATFPDPALGRLGDWTPPSLHFDWDPVEDLVTERNRDR